MPSRQHGHRSRSVPGLVLGLALALAAGLLAVNVLGGPGAASAAEPASEDVSALGALTVEVPNDAVLQAVSGGAAGNSSGRNVSAPGVRQVPAADTGEIPGPEGAAGSDRKGPGARPGSNLGQQGAPGEVPPAQVASEAGLGIPLVTKAQDEQFPMAGLAKVASAAAVLELLPPDQVLEVQPDSAALAVNSPVFAEVPGLDLAAGDTLTVEAALAAHLVGGLNNPIVLVAEQFPGGEAALVEAMNDQAAQLRLRDTGFVSVHGLGALDEARATNLCQRPEQGDVLPVDATQLRDVCDLTTAQDMAVLWDAANRNPAFRELAGLLEVRIADPSGRNRELLLTSSNRLLQDDPRVQGSRSGFLDVAGRCLVTTAEFDGRTVHTVVLGSANEAERNAFTDTTLLLDRSFDLLAERDENVLQRLLGGGSGFELEVEGGPAEYQPVQVVVAGDPDVADVPMIG